MAWIEAHQSLADHPKLIMASEILGVSEAQIIGHLMYLWWWALDRAPTGELSQYKPRIVERAARWEGAHGVFYAALLEVGFIDADGAIHDWHEYAGRLLERRAANVQRAQESRDRARTLRATSAHVAGLHNSNSNSTQQYPTQQNTTQQQQQQPPADDRTFVAVAALERVGILSSSHAAILKAWPEVRPLDIFAWAVYVENINRTRRNGNKLSAGFIVAELTQQHRAPDDCYAALPDPDDEPMAVLE